MKEREKCSENSLRKEPHWPSVLRDPANLPASFASTLNAPMVHCAIRLDRSQWRFQFSKHLRRLETRQVLRPLTMGTKCVQPYFNSQDDIPCVIEKLFLVSLLLRNLILMNNCIFGAP